MACGCNKKRTTSNRDLVTRGKKAAQKKPMPLVTVRREANSDKKKEKK